MPHGAALTSFVDAVLSFDTGAIRHAKAHLERALGGAGVMRAAAVAAMFQLNTRAADAAGIPIESPTVNGRSKIGVRLGFAPRESGSAP